MSTATSRESFRKEVTDYWEKHGRHPLPWRHTDDAYRILVSEVMLQQTQVPRVTLKYAEFLKKFPTVHALAKARLADVLKVWSGLGYNRRGKYLHDAAKAIVREHKGKVPREYTALRKLSGVGDYTARAVRVFAFNEPDVLIETNIRAAYIHHYFGAHKKVTDAEILPLAEEAAKGQDPREWHWALMDYGSFVKKLHQNPTRLSAHYVVQMKFEGSLRQVRGAILKLLTQGPRGDLALAHELSYDAKKVREALSGLKRDGLVVPARGSWRIA